MGGWFLLHRLFAAALLWAAALALPGGVGGSADAAQAVEFRNPDGVVVIVGNEAYEHPDVPRVSFAHRNMDSFRHDVVDVLCFDPENIVELRDASRRELFDTFGTASDPRGRLWSHLNPDGGSEVAVFHSGHSFPGVNEGRSYLLAVERQLKPGEHTALTAEVIKHIGKHGRLAPLEDVRDRAVAGRLAEIRCSTKDGARKALKRLDLLVASTGERLDLLRLQARAHRLLGDHASEAAAYHRWLLAAPHSHPERLGVLQALEQARQAVGEIARFEELLGRPFSVDAVEESVGWTDLHTAALLDLPAVVAALIGGGMSADVRLEEGGRPRFGDRLQRTLVALPKGEAFEGWHADGETPLMIAAVANARKAAEALIAGRAGVDTKNSKDGGQPLHYAASKNARDTAELLLDRGADIGAKNNYGNTPLHHAAGNDARETAELLLDRGSDIGAANNYGSTPLHYAAGKDARAIAELLLDRGTDIGATNNNGSTPLHHAAGKNARAIAELLLDRGTDIGAANNYGSTPLHHAAGKDARAIAELLLDRGTDIGATNNNGSTPLHYAAKNDARETAELLLDRGADIGAKNNYGNTPLHHAVGKNARETVALLLDRGADIGSTDNDGNTPLHRAADLGARETATFLLDRGADIGAKNNNGYTPLHHAALGNACAVAELLLDRGADIGATTNSGSTPLHAAAWMQARETAKLLLDRDAQVNATTRDGKTPLDYEVSTDGDAESRAVMQDLLRRNGGLTGEEVREEREEEEQHERETLLIPPRQQAPGP